jgi:hypothetical protein
LYESVLRGMCDGPARLAVCYKLLQVRARRSSSIVRRMTISRITFDVVMDMFLQEGLSADVSEGVAVAEVIHAVRTGALLAMQFKCVRRDA